MFFNTDGDEGHAISGYVALDNPAMTAELSLVVAGETVARGAANIFRPDILELGINNTGNVGFRFDESDAPGLSEQEDVKIVEQSSGLQVFGRFMPSRHIKRRLMLFDTAVMPQLAILNRITRNFALNYPLSERMSLETMIVVINNEPAPSVFINGRSNFSRYVGYLEKKEYLRAAVLRDPFDELAERLLFANLLNRPDVKHLVPTLYSNLEPLIEFASDLPFDDYKKMIAAFRRASPEVRQAIASPMTKIYACTPEESPQRRHVSTALENLASMNVVGTRRHFGPFCAWLEASLGATIFDGTEFSTFANTVDVAETLSRIGLVADLLDHDISLYTYFENAMFEATSDQEFQTMRDTQTR